MVLLTKPNQEWAMGFVHDAAGTRQTLRFFAVVDRFSRTCIRLVVDTAIPAARVIRELTAALAAHGKPERIRMDNGSEFTSRSFLAWCVEQKIETVHIRPGKPVENAPSESCNGRLREEVSNVTHFQHLWDAQQMTARWLRLPIDNLPRRQAVRHPPPRHANVGYDGNPKPAVILGAGRTRNPTNPAIPPTMRTSSESGIVRGSFLNGIADTCPHNCHK